nr:hypothetical protein [Lachnospiraceae bacterium]
MEKTWELCWMNESPAAVSAARVEGFDAVHPVIKNALAELGDTAVTIRKTDGLPKESYQYDDNLKTLTAGDEAGALYGAFRLVREQRLHGGVAPSFGPCIP